MLSKSATVWEGVKASLFKMCGVSPLSKLDQECMPLGSTEIDKSLGLKDFNEDQWFGG